MGRNKEMRRVSAAMQQRREGFAKKLKEDFEDVVFKSLSQLSGENLSKARGLSITYEVRNGEVSRVRDIELVSIKNKVTHISIKKRNYGFFTDTFTAFQLFAKDLDLYGMEIVKPRMPERNTKNARFTFFVRFDA